MSNQGWRIGDRGFTIFGPPNGNPVPEIIAHVKNRKNAPILAAAPALLEALEEAIEVLQPPAPTREEWETVAKARAAIAQARGEA